VVALSTQHTEDTKIQAFTAFPVAVSHAITRDPAKSLPPEEGVSGRLATAVVVALTAARVGVAARSGRHRLDALEVDEQVDGADDSRQRRDDDESQHRHRHGGRRGTGSRGRRRRVGRCSGRHEPDAVVFVRLIVVVSVRTRL